MYIRHSLVRKHYRDKPGIVFMHIPKTGGSSVATAIRRRYFFSTMNIKAGVSEKAGLAMAGAAENKEYIIQQLRASLVHYFAELGVKFITGHFFYAHSYVNLKEKNYRLIATVREPVDRWFSEYFYNRYKTVDHAKIDADLESYMESAEGIAKGSVLVKYLGGARNDNDYRSKQAVSDAMMHSDNMDVIGVLENFNGFVEKVQNNLGQRLVLPHKRKNPAYQSPEIYEQMKRYKNSAEIRAKLKEICEPDLAMYEHIKARD